MSVKHTPADMKAALNSHMKNRGFSSGSPRDEYLKQRQEEVREVWRRIMALLVMGAEQDANPIQRQKLSKHLPRLLRQFRHTGDPTPVIRQVEKIMFAKWEPSDPQIREHIEALRKAAS